MYSLKTYLSGLCNKVFKLLPMREAYDNGENNHLDKYLENLCCHFSGAFTSYPGLEKEIAIIEAYNNIAFLKNNDVSFEKWRSLVLRSTRLIKSVEQKREEV